MTENDQSERIFLSAPFYLLVTSTKDNKPHQDAQASAKAYIFTASGGSTSSHIKLKSILRSTYLYNEFFFNCYYEI